VFGIPGEENVDFLDRLRPRCARTVIWENVHILTPGGTRECRGWGLYSPAQPGLNALSAFRRRPPAIPCPVTYASILTARTLAARLVLEKSAAPGALVWAIGLVLGCGRSSSPGAAQPLEPRSFR
jgi:hypothetical protein